MARLFFIFVLFFASILCAEPQVILSSISKEEMSLRMQELASMKGGELDSHSRELLDELWEEASEIAELNDRCESISLSEKLDDACYEFYKTKLPEFENRYNQVTGEVRLSAWEIKRGVEDKGRMIEACYESFPLENADPSRLYVPDGTFDVEPLMAGKVELSYQLTLEPSRVRLQSLTNQLERWFKTCKSYILRNSSNEFAPMFVQKLNTQEKQNRNVMLQMRGEDRFEIVTKRDLYASYIMNGNALAQFHIETRTKIASIDAYGRVNVRYLREFDDSGRLELKSIRKGLKGQVEWSEGRVKSRPDQSSVSSPKPQVTEKYYEEPSRPSAAESYTYLAFQFRTGIGVGLGSVLDGVKDEYPAFWSEHAEEVSDSTFAHGFWTWIGMFNLHSGALSFGAGGGGALSWIEVNDAYDGDAVYLRTYVVPVAQVELGGRLHGSDSGPDKYDWEIGVRGTYMFDSKWPTTMAGVYFKIMDVFDLEFGWHYAKDLLNGFYGGINISLPPHTN